MKTTRAPQAARRLRQAQAAARPPGFFLRHLPVFYLLGLFLAAFVLYAGSLGGPFLFDDFDLFEARSAMRQKAWQQIIASPRPLLVSSFALSHWLSGTSPFGFHLVSVLLHALNTLILWGIARRICASPGLAGWLAPAARNTLALFVPLLFLATPVQTESVAYISSRSELLAATFYLAALLVFLSSWRERHRWLTAALVTILYAGSVTSKQHGLTLPGAILLADYFLLAESDWRRMRKNWPVYALLLAAMTAGGFLVVGGLLRATSAGFALAEVRWTDYLFTQFRMYFLYLSLLAVPFGLNVDYDIAPSRSLFEQGSWLALAGILALAAGAIHFRRRFVLASFGVLFFFLTLSPTSSFFPLLDYAAERRLYLPSAGFFLAALALAFQWWWPRRALSLTLGGIVLLYGAGTCARNRVWQDSLALWQDAVEKSPNKWRGHNNLGNEYTKLARFEEAVRCFQTAARLVRPDTKEHAEILSSLGSTFANRQMYAQAAETYRKALKISPDISHLWTNLAIAEIRLQKPAGWQYFQKAMDLNYLAWEPYLARANMYSQLGRFDEAIADYQQVLRRVPEHADAQYNLRSLMELKQRLKK